MKRFIALAVLCAASSCLHAQAIDTTVCEVLKNPQSFNGKIVRIKGTVVADFSQFVVKGEGCSQTINGLWLSYPEGTKGKAGPAAVLTFQPARNFAGAVQAAERTPVQLDKSKDFKQFDSLLSAQYKSSGMCLGCAKNVVTATLVGRLDGVAEAGLRHNKAGKIVSVEGFGNLNAYAARLVLQSVSEVSAQEVDFSKAAAAAKGDSVVDTGSKDGVAAAHQAAKVFGPGNPLGEQIERAANAFGKPGDDNGVNVGFGIANEVTAKSEAKGEKDSADGVLFNCTFDMGRLKGTALSLAIIYTGTQIADLRSPQPDTEKADVHELESHALQNAVLGAIGNNLKTLTLPGGYLAWNTAWAPADRDKALNDAIMNFLVNQALLGR
jgi:hypothetical protein